MQAGGGGGRAFLYDAGDDHEIAGFVGASGTVLDAIGAIVRPRSQSGAMKLFRCGPTGGVGGRAFSDADRFRRRPDLDRRDPLVFERLDDETFHHRFGDTPLARPGLARMRRNVALAQAGRSPDAS